MHTNRVFSSQIKYAKPPKSKQDDGEEEVAQRRVTRGRQVNYYDALMMSDETEEEEVGYTAIYLLSLLFENCFAVYYKDLYNTNAMYTEDADHMVVPLKNLSG